MQFFTKARENLLNSQGNAIAMIPDVTDWVYEHHFIISLFEAVNSMKQVLTEAGYREEHHYFSTPDGKLVLTDEAKHALRANCHNEHWEYLENYLLVSEHL